MSNVPILESRADDGMAKLMLLGRSSWALGLGDLDIHQNLELVDLVDFLDIMDFRELMDMAH